MELFRFPVESLPLRLLRPLSWRFVELLIFFGKLVRGGVRGLGLVGVLGRSGGRGPEGIFFICLCEPMRLQDVETV